MKHSFSACLLAMLLTACGGAPPPADWKLNAVSLLEHSQQRWLEGDGKSADLTMDQARKEIAKSGRVDLLARAELAACAARIASLDFATCSSFDELKTDAGLADKTYARFLAADWNGLDIKNLPTHYASLIDAKDDASANKAVAEIKDPLPRLIGAALLFKSGRADPATLATAIDTASEQGWRRPLLVWLEVLYKRALTSNDTAAATLIQRRIDLVQGTAKVH
ncbi:MAG: hypothetical protein B7Y41_15005 [Hydrogenophilales bacterium 28-61-23]|nr:MAG: hypothetical protein B7Y41_15005 [Hydrogenophilales bacterium 28-61-23]